MKSLSCATAFLRSFASVVWPPGVFFILLATMAASCLARCSGVMVSRSAHRWLFTAVSDLAGPSGHIVPCVSTGAIRKELPQAGILCFARLLKDENPSAMKYCSRKNIPERHANNLLTFVASLCQHVAFCHPNGNHVSYLPGKKNAEKTRARGS